MKRNRTSNVMEWNVVLTIIESQKTIKQLMKTVQNLENFLDRKSMFKKQKIITRYLMQREINLRQENLAVR